MTLETRLRKIERAAGPNSLDQPDRIYLCALTKDSTAEADPRVALLMRGAMNDDVSRLPDESAEAFRARVDAIMNETST